MLLNESLLGRLQKKQLVLFLLATFISVSLTAFSLIFVQFPAILDKNGLEGGVGLEGTFSDTDLKTVILQILLGTIPVSVIVFFSGMLLGSAFLFGFWMPSEIRRFLQSMEAKIGFFSVETKFERRFGILPTRYWIIRNKRHPLWWIGIRKTPSMFFKNIDLQGNFFSNGDLTRRLGDLILGKLVSRKNGTSIQKRVDIQRLPLELSIMVHWLSWLSSPQDTSGEILSSSPE